MVPSLDADFFLRDPAASSDPYGRTVEFEWGFCRFNQRDIEAILNDSDLVRRLRERDPAAFKCLSDRYLPSVWRFVCMRVDGDSHLAEDIVSETVLALVRAVSDESTADIENPGGWLRSVANHKVQDHYRAVARVRHLIDGAKQNAESVGQDDPAKHEEAREKRAAVRRAMDELSDQHRQALEWKYLDKLSVREIASRWEATEKAVESILFRARRELRLRLLKTDVADEVPQHHNGPSHSDSQDPPTTDPMPGETCSTNDDAASDDTIPSEPSKDAVSPKDIVT